MLKRSRTTVEQESDEQKPHVHHLAIAFIIKDPEWRVQAMF